MPRSSMSLLKSWHVRGGGGKEEDSVLRRHSLTNSVFARSESPLDPPTAGRVSGGAPDCCQRALGCRAQ